MSLGGGSDDQFDWEPKMEPPIPFLESGDPDGSPYPSFGESAQYLGFGEGAPPPRRRRRWPIALAATASVGLIALVLALVAPGGAHNANGQAIVIASVNHAVASKTAQATLTMNVNSGQMTGKGNGTIDFTDGAMDLTMQANLPSLHQALTIRGIYLGGTVYEHIAQISELVPGKSWVSIDLSGLNKVPGATGALNLGGNPAAMLRLLSARGATVTPTGTSTVNGVKVNGYTVTIDPAFIEKQISSANLPSWMRDASSKINFRNATETVFIDRSGNLRRDAVHMVIDIPSSQAGPMTMDETLDLSNYGVPVSISAPPASQVVDIQEFLRDTGSQSSN